MNIIILKGIPLEPSGDGALLYSLHSGDRSRRISVSSKPDSSEELVPGQARIHKETLSQNKHASKQCL